MWFIDSLSNYYHGFYVLHYITLRAILATFTAFGLSLVMGPKVIEVLGRRHMGQVIREDGPQTHIKKSGTPTMGGVLMLCTITLTVLLWADLDNRFIWVCLFVLIGFGIVGLIDDYRKIRLGNSRGLSARTKLLSQVFLACIASFWLYYTHVLPVETQLIIPFFKNISIQLGGYYCLLSVLVMVGTSNAVNLTDGLDGLAILPVVMVAAALGVFAYLAGHIIFSHYLVIPYVMGVGEISVFCATIVGAGLGFLWFNTYPAQVFMGDVGSLGIGAVLGVIAVIARQEFALVIMGGVFVMETVSVILQVVSFKLTGNRLFRMAPLHHHYELKGWPEPKIIVRFWIITLLLVLMSLSTLKLR